MPPQNNVEKLMQTIGDPGKFQVLIFAVISINFAIMLPTHLVMIFYAAKTKHHCSVANGENVSDLVPIVFTTNKKRRWDSCNLYKDRNKTQTIPCNNGWTYYMEDRETTIISEFDLVCDDAYKADLATTIYFCGVTLGGVFFGSLADKFGRKPIIAVTLLATAVISMAIFIFRTYITFVVLRFFLGLVIQGLQSSSMVLALELFSMRSRGRIGIFCGVASNTGVLCFALLVYLVKDWRYIQLALSIVPFLQLTSLWVIPESFRWHLLHGNFQKAEATIKRIVKFNRVPFPEELFQQIKEQSSKELAHPKTTKRVNVLKLYSSSSLRKISIILMIVWFSISVAFYGLSFNISFLFGDKYLNFAVGQIIDLTFISSLLWSVPRFGRRKPLILTIFVAAVASVICAVIASLNTDSRDLSIIRTVTALGGKAFSSSAIVIMLLFTAELYPTILRNVGFGVNMFWGRAGAMVAPQVFFLGQKTSTLVPYTIVGIMMLMSCLLVLFLPETRKQVLMDRLEHTGFRRTPCDEDEQQIIVKGDFTFETSL